MAGQRPVGVTVVAVIAWISGALNVIGGIIQMLPGGDNFAAGVWALIIGVVTILVSIGLFRGSNGARVVVTIVFVLNLLSAFFLLFSPFTFWTALFSALLAVIGIALLYTRPANAFFR